MWFKSAFYLLLHFSLLNIFRSSLAKLFHLDYVK